MIHFRQKLSIEYWAYAIATALAATKLATWFFNRTKPKMSGKYSSKLQRLWWRLYLLNFLYYADETKLKSESEEKVAIKWVQPYHLEFWNAFFHTSCLSHVAFEIANGKTPYIDDKYGVWSSFFSQPVFDTEHPEDLPANTVKNSFFTSRYAPYNRPVTKIWLKLFHLYVRFNPVVSEYAENELEQVLECPEKTLGVICRGTDYIILRPKNHPKQPKVDDVIKWAKKWIRKYGYTKIYLATEEEAIFKRFEKAFPGMVLTNKRTYYDKHMEENNLTEITAVHFDRENDDYLKGLEYLSSLNILSKCDAILGGNCGGTKIAMFFNDGKYSRIKIFDRGIC